MMNLKSSYLRVNDSLICIEQVSNVVVIIFLIYDK